jgi:hypothetical protein
MFYTKCLGTSSMEYMGMNCIYIFKQEGYPSLGQLLLVPTCTGSH